MKTILILTDFSENAKRAAETAAFFAEKLHANLLLLNSNNVIPAIPYNTEELLPDENVSWEKECKRNLESLAKYIKEVLAEVNPHYRKSTVRVLLKEGELATSIAEVARKENIELIVMGAGSGSRIDHLLFGSDTSSVIDHSNHPVLIVPVGGSISKIDRMIFATNFNEVDILVIEYLIELGQFFEYQLEIAHITLYGNPIRQEKNKVKDFIEQLGATQHSKIIFHDIRGKDILSRLDHLCEERDADILAFTHLQQPIFKRMFKEGNIKKALSNQKLPLLIFPSDRKNTTIKEMLRYK
jgi:nucleotide-binding universal stress UspA family protein